jgi:hypothetical protein
MLMKLSSSMDGDSALLDTVVPANTNDDGQATMDNQYKAAEHVPLRLALTEDSVSLNALHCCARSHLLEIMLSVDLRHSCRSQSMYSASQTRAARMAILFPNCMENLYRQVYRWQGIHWAYISKCWYMPVHRVDEYHQLEESDKTRGTTRYWFSSANRRRLVKMVDDHTMGMDYLKLDVKRLHSTG